MIKSTDPSVHDDIHEILLDEYTMLLELYEMFIRTNKLESAFKVKVAMQEVSILSCKMLDYDISLCALKRFR